LPQLQTGQGSKHAKTDCTQNPKGPKGSKGRGKHAAGRAAEHARLENVLQGHHIDIAEALGCNPCVWHLQALSNDQKWYKKGLNYVELDVFPKTMFIGYTLLLADLVFKNLLH